jgi:hypothetical protein
MGVSQPNNTSGDTPRHNIHLRAHFENMERGCVVLDQPQPAMKSRLIMLASSAAAGLRHSRAPFLKQALSGWARRSTG